MATSREWDLTQYSKYSNVHLAVRVKSALPEKSFVVGFDCENPQSFQDLNPQWYMSESLGMPFRYMPTVESGPQVVDLWEIQIPKLSGEMKIVLKPWKRYEGVSFETVDVLIVTFEAENKVKTSDLIEGGLAHA
ncbi:hypothetical protein [Gulosibacter sediminis]|uniref:hypothetical protein n=1 Tax=Gulosibacter sediminis TaxID=1729695 RepID=UPI0024ADFDA6|nr:hypothetical protein [Gulosibacter sediminis]